MLHYWGRSVILYGIVSSLFLLLGGGRIVNAAISGYKDSSPTQYHIQTDEGKERFFRFQTYNGQYRKERRLDDGTVIGSYGWVDPTGYLRMTDYIADSKGYRVVKNSMQFVGTNSILPEESKKKVHHHSKESSPALPRKIGLRVPLRGKTPFKVVKKKILYEPSPSASIVSRVPSPLGTLPVSPSSSPPVLVVYGPLRSANVRNAKLVTRRRPQGVRVESAEETPGDVFGKYNVNRPLRVRTPGSAFIYRIPEQYHREETMPEGRLGSYGYVDPFGIRRVIHYTTNNATGFTAQRDFKFVGRPTEEQNNNEQY